MSTHNKYINRKKIVTRPRNRMGGENFKKATIATITIIIAAMIITSGAWLSNGHLAPSGGSPQVIATLVGNASNPHPYYNTTNGYVSPNLWGAWGLDNSRSWTITMKIFSNSSIFTLANLSNITKNVPIQAYSSVHFTHGLPMSLTTVDANNLSSFVSFKILNKSSGTFYDMAYDLFLGNKSTLQYEVMIMLYAHIGWIDTSKEIGFVTIPTVINGTLFDVKWNILPFSGNMIGSKGYEFIPAINTNVSMSYTIDLSLFLSYLERSGYLPSSCSILRLGIGSEYGTNFSDYVDYSFWMNSYFILNGKDYQIVQPPEVL